MPLASPPASPEPTGGRAPPPNVAEEPDVDGVELDFADDEDLSILRQASNKSSRFENSTYPMSVLSVVAFHLYLFRKHVKPSPLTKMSNMGAVLD